MTAGGGEPSNTERAVRRLLQDALDTYADDPVATIALRRHRERLDEPLRVAIAGKLKAGKSTLLNALVGEEIAPTDATECTRVLTWYEHGAAPRITVHPNAGPPAELPVVRADGRLQLDLGGHEVGDVDHLTVAWPARSLRAATLIDTPGIDSLSVSVSRRTLAFLAPEDEPSDADAMIYLIRHLHDSDLRLLESFRDTACGRATMINTIGVLARADEIGGGRIDSLISAGTIAARYREHPMIRQLCSTVVPVVGLLAQAGRTLRQAEYEALAVLAGEPRAVTNSMLLSVDRFAAPDAPVPLASDRRIALIDRLGLFGVRLALTFVRSGMRDPTILATELVRRSGLEELRQLLATQFTERSAVLKARSTMLAVNRLIRTHPRRGTDGLAASLERVVAGAHELRELALIASLRAGRISFAQFGAGEDRAAERLLGASGAAAVDRLGLAATGTDADVRDGATEAIHLWRARAQSALVDRQTADGCLVVVRSCEGVLAELSGGAVRPAS